MDICNLPEEMLIRIFTYLPFNTIKVMAQVCPLFNDISFKSTVWNSLPVTFDSRQTTLEGFETATRDYFQVIKVIVFRCVNSYDKIFAILNQCPKITKLHMVMCCIDQRINSNLESFPNLKLLSFNNSYESKDNKFSLDFTHLSRIERIAFSNFGLSNDNFNGLLASCRLTHVILAKIKNITQENMSLLFTTRKDILEAVAIYGEYDDQLTKIIADCPNIFSVKIIRCDFMTNKSLRYLRSMKKLTELSLWNNSKFTHLGLLDLFTFPTMSNLSFISFSKVSNLRVELFDDIAVKCRKLTFIGIYCCPLIIPSVNIVSLRIKFPRVKVYLE